MNQNSNQLCVEQGDVGKLEDQDGVKPFHGEDVTMEASRHRNNSMISVVRVAFEVSVEVRLRFHGRRVSPLIIPPAAGNGRRATLRPVDSSDCSLPVGECLPRASTRLIRANRRPLPPTLRMMHAGCCPLSLSLSSPPSPLPPTSPPLSIC